MIEEIVIISISIKSVCVFRMAWVTGVIIFPKEDVLRK